MAQTARGYPYPVLTDPADIEAFGVEALAQKVNDNPGIPTLTTAGRDALPAAEVWLGKLIFNTTAGEYQRCSGVGPPATWTNDVAPVYETSAEAQAKVDAHAGGADPHPVYATDADLTTHAGLPNVHHPKLHGADHGVGGVDQNDDLASLHVLYWMSI